MTDLELDQLIDKIENGEITETGERLFRTKIDYYKALERIGFLPYDPTETENYQEHELNTERHE